MIIVFVLSRCSHCGIRDDAVAGAHTAIHYPPGHLGWSLADVKMTTSALLGGPEDLIAGLQP